MTAPALAPAAPHRAAGPATTDPRDALVLLAQAYQTGQETDEAFAIHRAVDQIAGAGGTEAETWARFEDLARAVEDRDLLNGGLLHWSEIEPGLTGPDPSDAAADIARDRVDDALNALLKGAQ